MALTLPNWRTWHGGRSRSVSNIWDVLIERQELEEGMMRVKASSSCHRDHFL
jgi:hypothetical protein